MVWVKRSLVKYLHPFGQVAQLQPSHITPEKLFREALHPALVVFAVLDVHIARSHEPPPI